MLTLLLGYSWLSHAPNSLAAVTAASSSTRWRDRGAAPAGVLSGITKIPLPESRREEQPIRAADSAASPDQLLGGRAHVCGLPSSQIC